jgi:probable HAF family extracellular repeat protein
MSALRRLRNFWMPWVAMVVLGCFSNAVAQTSYKVIDLGVVNDKDNLSCAMDLNNFGWTLSQEGVLDPVSNFSGAPVLSGRAVINIGEFKIDLGTLGGPNSWMNWGGINDFAQAVGDAETAVPDPNGEDICGFGTHLTCRPFLWQFGHMSALPTLGGNNGQASDINNRGQIAGFAENGTVDSSCPANATNNRIQLPVLWENGKARVLPTVDGDPDGVAFAINDHGHAVGDTQTCGGAIQHAVSWENGTAIALQDFGTGATSQGINNQCQIFGIVVKADNTTEFGALWQNGALTSLGTLPGDFASIATGINSRGQIVGSTLDSGFNWVHGFIYQDGKMTDLNTLFPASSNLFATMANKINERGQITGMATVLSGPHTGDIHTFLATPVNERTDRSVADIAPTHPKSNLPTNVNKQLLHRFVLSQLAQ